MSKKGKRIKFERILDRFNRRGRNRGQASIWRMFRGGMDIGAVK